MEKSFHRFSDLFAQLGLPSDTSSIKRFIMEHRPLGDQVSLADASFWSQSQANFLREELLIDADWAEVIDHLSAALRAGD